MQTRKTGRRAISTKDGLSEQAAAGRCGWSYPTIRRHRFDGSGPPYFQVGGRGKRIVYPSNELEAWISANLKNRAKKL